MILHPGASAKVTQDDQPGGLGLHIRDAQIRTATSVLYFLQQALNKVVHREYE